MNKINNNESIPTPMPIGFMEAHQWDHLLGDCGMDYVPTYKQRENLKYYYWKTLQAYEKGETDLEELVDAAEDRLRAWFFRSAERAPLMHPRFPVYVSMLLNEEHIRMCFPVEVVGRLVDKYGQRKGEIEGSYWTHRKVG